MWMTTTAAFGAEARAWEGAVFDSILCGVDGAESSNAAVAQASHLLAPHGTLELITVVDENAGDGPVELGPAELERRYARGQTALHKAQARYACTRSHLVFGDTGPSLVSAARHLGATLAAVGARAGGLSAGPPVDRVAAYLLHHAPCSVLIARPAGADSPFPRAIVVGLDGSIDGEAAARVAADLAARNAADLRVVTTADSVLRLVGALAGASAECDLLVVSGRGADRGRTLGSVAEGIVQLARCSVLVVRDPGGDADAPGAHAGFPAAASGRPPMPSATLGPKLPSTPDQGGAQ